jgi:hypothetical protein
MSKYHAVSRAVLPFLLTLPSFALAQNPDEPVARYGVYSSMHAVDGHYAGFEFIIVTANEGDVLVFQMAEGWPSKPLVLQLERTDRSDVVFDHPEMGPFKGTIRGDTLSGEFTRMKYRIELRRGASFWQRPVPRDGTGSGWLSPPLTSEAFRPGRPSPSYTPRRRT